MSVGQFGCGKASRMDQASLLLDSTHVFRRIMGFRVAPEMTSFEHCFKEKKKILHFYLTMVLKIIKLEYRACYNLQSIVKDNLFENKYMSKGPLKLLKISLQLNIYINTRFTPKDRQIQGQVDRASWCPVNWCLTVDSRWGKNLPSYEAGSHLLQHHYL